MKKYLWAMGIVTAGCIGFAGVASAEGIKEGEWTMTVTTKVAGMEDQMAEMEEAMANMSEAEKAMMAQMMGGMNVGMGAEGMTTSITQCISGDDPVPHASDEEGCNSTHNINGNTVTFETTCPDGISTGEVTYEDESMSGVISSNADGEQVTIEIRGEYVGPCPAE